MVQSYGMEGLQEALLAMTEVNDVENPIKVACKHCANSTWQQYTSVAM